MSSAVRLREKQLKVPHTGRAAPIVNEATSVCVGLGRIDSLGNASEGGVGACGRQLNDLQYEV